MKRGNEETDYYAYLKLLVYCCVALFVCKCLCHSLYILSASEMTYIVSGGALNSTHSLTHSLYILMRRLL